MRPWPALLVLALTGCAKSPPDAAADAQAGPVEIAKPPLDDRDYRYLTLDNGLQALLISDADTDMAAAALDVHVGQFSDPKDREGLAHFLEHMLFMGTDKYPDVDGYRDFVQSHGGGTNAATSQEHTRYHFDIEHAHLEEALDRFAQFFIAPTLDPEYVQREREAVNSEYRLKIQDEARRFREVRRETTNQDHGFAKFSVGNLETLADRDGAPVWDDLKAFYDAEYSASRMALSIIGRQDLDALEAMVRDRFALVPTTGADAPRQMVPPYLATQLGVRIDVTPITDKREVYLEWPVPVEAPHFAEHPLGVLSYLVGQEGEGSIHAVLNAKGWITSLSSGSDGAEDHGLLTVRIGLTEDGYTHVDDVVDVVFQYVRLLRDTDDLSPWWDQEQRLAELNFRYAEPPSAVSAVRRGSSALQLYPPEHALDWWATYTSYDPFLQRKYLDRLKPGNVRMFVVGPDLETDQVEPRYDVPWAMTPIPAALKQRWATSERDPALALPEMNPYIAEDTTLHPVDGEVGVPVKTVDEERLTVWHLLDPSFGVPRSTTRATLVLPAATTDMAARVNAWLYTDLVDDVFGPKRDQLRTAGLSTRFGPDSEGLQLRIDGYDDKHAQVLDEYLGVALGYEVDPERFAVLRDDLVRSWRNLTKNRSIDQVGWALSEATDPTDWDYQAGADHLQALTPEALQTWLDGLYASSAVEVVVHGNHTAAEAEAMGRAVLAALEGDGADRPPVQLRRLPASGTAFRDVTVEHADSAIRVVYQADDTSLAAQAPWLMLGSLIRTPAFTQLRTEQQLGYIVWGGYDRRDHLAGLGLGIQSNVAEPQVLLERIDAFLADYADTLEAMPDEEYETVKAGLIASLEEDPTDLYDLTRDLLRDLDLGVTTFDRKAQLVALLKPLPKAEVLALLRDEVIADGTGRLVVRAVGQAHAETVLDPAGCADTPCIAEKMGEDYRRDR